MANDLNQCNFIGRLGKDPESKFLANGTQVCNFSIAVGSSWKDKTTGQKAENTEWINIDAFGNLAGICAEYLRKGSKVFISGEFKTRKWQDQSGNDRYSTSIKAMNMQMLDSRQDSPQSNGHPPSPPQQAPQQHAPQQQQAPAPQQPYQAPQQSHQQAPQTAPQGHQPPPGYGR